MKKPVLTGVSLEIKKREFTGLVGPNGAGKTTLLRGVLGLVQPLEGTVFSSEGTKNRIGYVPQREQLDANFPLTAFDVVKMGVTAHKPWHQWPHKQDHDKTGQALATVRMESFAHHSFDRLSGGQRQRVLIARALAVHPIILVLDEPTSGIDKENEENILELLEDLCRTKEMAVVMVTHRMETLRSRIHQLISVEEGKARVLRG